MAKEWGTLKLLKCLSKPIIAMNWFSRIAQGGIIISKDESWIKMNANVLNRRLIACIIRLKNMLWRADL